LPIVTPILGPGPIDRSGDVGTGQPRECGNEFLTAVTGRDVASIDQQVGIGGEG